MPELQTLLAKANNKFFALLSRASVRVLLEVRMDSLAKKFYETHDMKVKDEIERLAREYGKLDEPWVFVAMSTRILVLINPIPAHL
jgi:hypothetical protein